MIPAVGSLLARKAILAPMLATTDIPFRRVCRDFGAAHTMTEMVSARGIARNNGFAYRCAAIDPDEGSTTIQLATVDTDETATAIERLLPLKPAAININAGCPNGNLRFAGAGAGLLDNLRLLSNIVRTAVSTSGLPVSVKVRLKHWDDPESTKSIMRTIEDAGASFIIVHARIVEAGYDMPARWEGIATAKECVTIPVVGNGDVFSARDAFAMMDATGCDAVLVARGALGTPWIFRDIALGRRCGPIDHAPPASELRGIVMKHLRMIEREFGPVYALPRIRKHALWYARHYDGLSRLRHRIFATEDIPRIIEETDRHFADDPPLLDAGAPHYRSIEQSFRKRVLYWLPSSPAGERA
ncbi:MAG: tRNA-dihydrouridine synthase [Bacteroidota bacterium]|nr:tRNA-dihydrouridine synthase [Bacteroidota bacterium]